LRRGGLRGRILPVAILLGWLGPASASADSVTVPLGLQVDLLVKVADYDRTLPGRTSGVVRVVVLVRAGSPESSAAAGKVLDALSGVPRISGLPHEDTLVPFKDVASLVELCRTSSTSIVYLTPGLADVSEALSKALAGIPVFTVAASAEGAQKGAVLGFDLIASKPKLLVNLASCRNQGVRLSSDVLRIATVIE